MSASRMTACCHAASTLGQVRYELPLAHARNFWEPPARLLVRLDGARGTGVHLTPGGLEFDEQVGLRVMQVYAT